MSHTKNKKQETRNKKQKGISLLFIVLITSFILAIGLGLSALLIQEMKMMSEIGYSVIAFYAADTGIEHGLYKFYQEEWTGSLTSPDPSYKADVTVVLPETAILSPSGNGDEINLDIGGSNPAPTNWESVDDPYDALPDSNTTYVYYTNPVEVRDLYELGYSYPIDPIELEQIKTKSIARAIVHFNVAQSGTGGTAAPLIKTHGTVFDGYEEALSAAWTPFSQTWPINPETNSVWTWDEIDNLQAGIILAGATSTPLCTQVYVEVETKEEVHITSSGAYQNTTRAIEASYFK